MPALLALREDRVEGIRLEAAVEALEADHPVVRRAALDALGHLAEHHGQPIPARVAPRARDLTADEDPEVRAEACASLALLPREDEADLEAREAVLAVRLDDPHPEVRQEAAAALGDLAVLGRAAGPATRDRIALHLDDEDPRVRFEAAFALASLGDGRARPPLEAALGRRRLRADAIEGLARLGDPEALPALLRVSGGFLVPWADRLATLAARARLGDPEAGPALIDRLGARRLEERIHAAALIGQLGLAEAAPHLRALASRAREPAREAAIEALGRVGSEDDIAWLDAWSRDPHIDPATRAAACEAIAGRATSR